MPIGTYHVIILRDIMMESVLVSQFFFFFFFWGGGGGVCPPGPPALVPTPTWRLHGIEAIWEAVNHIELLATEAIM